MARAPLSTGPSFVVSPSLVEAWEGTSAPASNTDLGTSSTYAYYESLAQGVQFDQASTSVDWNNITPAAQDIGIASLSWHFYIENMEDWSDPGMQIYAGTSAWAINQFYQVELNFCVNGWNVIGQPITTDGIAQAIRNLRPRVTKASADAPKIWLDSVYGGFHRRGVLILTYDDDAPGQDTLARDQLDAAGLKGTFAVIAPANDQLANFKAMQENGHLFIPHGNTNLTDFAYKSEMVAEVQSVLDANAANHLILDKRFYTYPNGGYNSTVLEAVQEAGIKMARVVGSAGHYVIGHAKSADDLFFRYGTPQIGWLDGDTVSDITGRIDTMIAQCGFSTLMFHSVVSSGATGISINASDHQLIVDHIVKRQNEGLLDCMTWAQFYESFGGPRESSTLNRIAA